MNKLLALLLVASPAFAHDFWIEPSTFRPGVKTILDVSLRQGEYFVGDAVPRDPSRIDQFIAIDATGIRPVDGIAGVDPAGFIQAGTEGLMIIGYRTKPKANEPLAADRFEKYLRDEGLERVVELRAARRETQRAGLEMFSRSAKALVLTGKAPRKDVMRVDRPLGFRFEIIPETNPYSAPLSSTLKFRLLFEGKPVPNVLVFAMHREDAKNRLQARTGRDGRVAFKLSRPGVWMVKAVHMIPAARETNVDWESIWASVTFER